jgi:hypothetical protein
LESHGGYLLRLEELDIDSLVQLAARSLSEDGQDPRNSALLATAHRRARVLRLAYDSPHTYGRRGARWYLKHHVLAKRLSVMLRATVHAYVFDPEELEQVTSYGGGHVVGGECIRYEEAELPDSDDDEAFERLKQRWPLGHLAKVLGTTRGELIRLPRSHTVLLELDGSRAGGSLMGFFPPERATPRRVDSRRVAAARGTTLEEP